MADDLPQVLNTNWLNSNTTGASVTSHGSNLLVRSLKIWIHLMPHVWIVHLSLKPTRSQAFQTTYTAWDLQHFDYTVYSFQITQYLADLNQGSSWWLQRHALIRQCMRSCSQVCLARPVWTWKEIESILSILVLQDCELYITVSSIGTSAPKGTPSLSARLVACCSLFIWSHYLLIAQLLPIQFQQKRISMRWG